MSVSLVYLRGLGVESVRGSQSWVRGVILELDGGRLSQIVVRTKANEVLMTIFELGKCKISYILLLVDIYAQHIYL